MFKIILKTKVKKFLEKHKGEYIIQSFLHAVEILENSPYHNNLDITILNGYKNFYRLRIGKYRFLYEIIENKLIIRFTDSDSRGSIYK